MMTEQELLERLRQDLKYDPETGKFTWLTNRSRSARVGAEAGFYSTNGYRYIKHLGTRYWGHRLAWLMTYGHWPSDQLDHINGDRSDNRIVNLRECTNAENQQNKTKNRNNTSGLMGVTWRKDRMRWVAQIMLDRKKYNLGFFTDKHAAHRAYCEAKAQLHPFHPTPRTEASLTTEVQS